MVNIKERIESLLNAKGWTKFELSKRANLSHSTINEIFNGKASPRVDTLSVICDAFSITLAEFFNENYLSKEDIVILSSYNSLGENQQKIIDLIFALLK